MIMHFFRKSFEIKQTIRAFSPNASGSTLVEFAFIVPIILLILLGGFDMARYILLNQKLDRAAATMSDLVSRPPNISKGEIDQLMIAAIEVVQPFDLATKGGVIISSIYKQVGKSAKVTWQITGGGPVTPTSMVGSVGNTPTMPAGFIVRDSENVITAEVFFDYKPLFLDALKNIAKASDFLPDGIIVQTAFRQPRLGDLSTLATP
jgi:Flp pilus assembly protein TadG